MRLAVFDLHWNLNEMRLRSQFRPGQRATTLVCSASDCRPLPNWGNQWKNSVVLPQVHWSCRKSSQSSLTPRPLWILYLAQSLAACIQFSSQELRILEIQVFRQKFVPLLNPVCKYQSHKRGPLSFHTRSPRVSRNWKNVLTKNELKFFLRRVSAILGITDQAMSVLFLQGIMIFRKAYLNGYFD